jgi:Mrp family chromosome partitioning ATPase
MSRIHDALQKAQREREFQTRPTGQDFAVPGLKPVTPEKGMDVRGTSAAPLVRPLPDRDIPLVRFSAEGLAVLSRSYEPIERLCARPGGVILAPGSRVLRTVLVAHAESAGNSAPTALALAATLAEKSKSRTLLVDGDAAGRALEAFCALDQRGPGLLDLVFARAEVGRCVRRTELAGLYYLPAGYLPDELDGKLETGAAGQALRSLLERFDFLVVAVGSLHEGALATELARHAEAVLLAARDPGAAFEHARAHLGAHQPRVHVIGDVFA